MQTDVDFLILGTGVAGLNFALKACEYGKVLLVAKSKFQKANSRLAQGGIASVTASSDSFENHLKDTLTAGAGLCSPSVVQSIVEEGPARIQDLIDYGVKFDSQPGSADYSLTQEGGHSDRRILHISDHTGEGIHQVLLETAMKHPNIELIEDHLAVELITLQNLSEFKTSSNQCLGAYLLNKNSMDTFPVVAKATILATGGAGKTYLYTSNWEGATGDGLAMAFRAGARVANLEFMQFHPTCLYHPNARNFLISEALRGEGGELVNHEGRAFMSTYHKLKNLAPRDIVARGIDAEMKKTGADCVFLDMTHLNPHFLETRFPTIHSKCLELGINITKEPIPVVPAAHYLCGGVLTNDHGETDLKNLYAVGETACTGLHGANRLASNSLLECLVLSHRAAEHIKPLISKTSPFDVLKIPSWPHKNKQDPDELIVIGHMWEEVRHLMWNYVGIVRSNRRLKRASTRLQNIKREIAEYYSNTKTHPDLVELRNIALVADLTVQCALLRAESRGIHYNLDYPELKGEESPGKNTIISPQDFIGYGF